MRARRSREPILWALFGGGGMMAALFLPVLLGVLLVAAPMGWIELVAFADLQVLVRNPLVRLGLFGLVFLSFFHWAHRFRYTLYDGLQLSHLNELIAILTYGVATALSLTAGYLLWSIG